SWRITTTTLSLLNKIELVTGNGQWPEAWYMDAPEIIQHYAVSECLTYLAYCADERGMKAPQGEKTRLTMINILQDYSISQAYSLIWRSAANAADYLVRRGVLKAQAANSIVTRLQNSADRARAENWNVKGFARPKECPRSQFNHTLYDVFLKIGERGFTESLKNMQLPNGYAVFPNSANF
ncbi:MAG: hypothetical protein GX776_02735, partial [Oxalobacter sp.]|nr:hypothetical protein [Oxalobacter sp.]